MSFLVRDLLELLGDRGSVQYGDEAISQREHALQCALLAEQAGERPETVVACLIHDLGHLLADRIDEDRHTTHGHDDLHQYIALPFLRPLFPASVLEPVKLHVDAKRYLCSVDATYWASLSPASQRSLEQQGGAFSAEEAERFMGQPFAAEAVRLRRYDDFAKVRDKAVPELSYFADRLERVRI